MCGERDLGLNSGSTHSCLCFFGQPDLENGSDCLPSRGGRIRSKSPSAAPGRGSAATTNQSGDNNDDILVLLFLIKRRIQKT